MPAEGSIIPLLVEEDRLKDAIAVSKTDDGIVFVLSPIIAAFIFTNISLTAAFLFVAILDCLAGLLQFTIRTKKMDKSISDEEIHFWENFKEGVSVIFSNSKLKNFALVLPVINAFFGATFSVSILYLIREVYKMNAYYYGMYNSVTAVTSVIVPIVVLPFVSKSDSSRIFSISTKLIAVEIALIGMVVVFSFDSRVPVSVALLMIIALGELLFGVLNDIFSVYVSIFVGSIGVGAGSLFIRAWGGPAPVKRNV